jgi:predicted GNAT superfamily acetyltransferase
VAKLKLKYMKITDNNGYLFYHIEDGEIIIDDIKAFEQKKGTGKKLINQLKDIAIENSMPICLCSCPQDDTITQSELDQFYLSLGFTNIGADLFSWEF